MAKLSIEKRKKLCKEKGFAPEALAITYICEYFLAFIDL